MWNKELLISACVCLLLIIFSAIETILYSFSYDMPLTDWIELISHISNFASFLCVIGAFVFDGVGKRRKAIACAVFCLVDALIWHVILNILLHALYAESMTIKELFTAVFYIIPDVLLIVFVSSERRSCNTWLVIGIVLTLLAICNDCISIPFILLRIMRDFRYYDVAIYLLSIPFGLVYLFGFMDKIQSQKNKREKRTTSYLEQYKQEHGMK